MQLATHQDLSKFFVAGINYKKTDAAVRGLFAIGDEQHASLLQVARESGIPEVFVLSTCNRTEIYGIAPSADALVNLLCKYTEGSREMFVQRCYIREGFDAINHLFNVGAGLDSQILGDYEIVGQIKIAVKYSKQFGTIGSFIERLVNSVLQSSKNIKNNTGLSGGTVSVSFAAVQYIRESVTNIRDKKILLLGVGKIGRNTGKNLVDYLETTNITLINRSPEKAEGLAEELGVRSARIEALEDEIAAADIIVVATNATSPTILKEHLLGKGEKLIIDLSIPYNVEANANTLEGIHVVNVDELSKLKDETLQKREAEVPKAKAIIGEHIAEFIEWYEMRKHVPVLKAVKLKLEEIHGDPVFLKNFVSPALHHCVNNRKEKIQKIINGMALKMRHRNQRGCHYIEAINEYMAIGAN